MYFAGVIAGLLFRFVSYSYGSGSVRDTDWVFDGKFGGIYDQSKNEDKDKEKEKEKEKEKAQSASSSKGTGDSSGGEKSGN